MLAAASERVCFCFDEELSEDDVLETTDFDTEAAEGAPMLPQVPRSYRLWSGLDVNVATAARPGALLAYRGYSMNAKDLTLAPKLGVSATCVDQEEDDGRERFHADVESELCMAMDQDPGFEVVEVLADSQARLPRAVSEVEPKRLWRGLQQDEDASHALEESADEEELTFPLDLLDADLESMWTWVSDAQPAQKQLAPWAVLACRRRPLGLDTVPELSTPSSATIAAPEPPILAASGPCSSTALQAARKRSLIRAGSFEAARS